MQRAPVNIPLCASECQPGDVSFPGTVQHFVIALSPGLSLGGAAMLIYEHKMEKPLSTRAFLRRMMNHGLFVAVVVSVSVAIGTLGYHALGQELWLDSFVNACMLLGGMGQVGDVQPTAGKFFSAIFSLYSGLVFIVSLTTFFAPVMHRVIHKFHWDASATRHAR
jgi:hypothetical protein